MEPNRGFIPRSVATQPLASQQARCFPPTASTLVSRRRPPALRFTALRKALYGGDGVCTGSIGKPAAALDMSHDAVLPLQGQCQLIPWREADRHFLWRRTIELNRIIALGQQHGFVRSE